MLSITTSTPWKGNCTTGGLLKRCVDFCYYSEKMLLSLFSHWLLVHIRSIPCHRETTDAIMTICVVCVLLPLEKVPLNVYGPFGHTPVTTYFALTVMDTSFDINIILYCSSTSYYVKFWSEPETGNNEIYAYACVVCVIDQKICHLRYAIAFISGWCKCRIDNSHVHTLTT